MFFSKTYPSFLTVKEGSTSHLGLLPSGKKRETALLGTVYAPPVPPQREGPYPIPKPYIPTIGIRDVTALRCSEPLRSKVGGPSKVFAMIVRDGTAWGYKYLHGRIVHSIRYSYSFTGLSKILSLTICRSFLCLHHNIEKNIADIAVNIVTIKNTDEAIGEEEKSATNKEHRKEAKIETDAIANSKHKSDVLLLHNSSISSFVTS